MKIFKKLFKNKEKETNSFYTKKFTYEYDYSKIKYNKEFLREITMLPSYYKF